VIARIWPSPAAAAGARPALDLLVPTVPENAIARCDPIHSFKKNPGLYCPGLSGVPTENVVRGGADVAMGYPHAGMLDPLKLLVGFVVGLFRSQVAREADMAFLRQQLLVLKRSTPARLKLRIADRLIFVSRQIRSIERHREEEAQGRYRAIDALWLHTTVGLVDLEAADILGRRRVRRPPGERSEAPHEPDIITLRVMPQAARRHVFKHPPAQRAHGL
jgi:hypothetical protein